MRPHKVLEAASRLENNSPLYQEQGIILDPNWMKNMQIIVKAAPVTVNIMPIVRLIT